MTGKPHNNTNPRKFKEKIELLRQNEAQLTANFMEVMRGIPTLTRNVIPYPDLANKNLSPTGTISPSPRMSLDSLKLIGGSARGIDNSGNYQYPHEKNSGTANRSLYNNSGGNDSGGGDGGERELTSNQISRTESSSAAATDTQPRPARGTQGRSRGNSKSRTWGRNQSNAESRDSGLILRISPLRGPQSSPSPSFSYQPNLASVSSSPHSPSPSSLPPTSANHSVLHPPPAAAPSKFYPSNDPSPSINQHQQCQQFHPPAAPPPIQPHSANHPTDYEWRDTENPVDGESAGIPGGMSLMDYRRTYSDSCIPSSFTESHRRFQQQQDNTSQSYQQQVQSQSLYPPPQHVQPAQTLPPVNELTSQRYHSMNNTGTEETNSTNPTTGGGSFFNGTGLSLSPRCRHQSSITVSQQRQQNPSWRKVQPDYHSMRNIPERYAPLHHHNHHQMLAMNPQHQQLAATGGMMMEGYDAYVGGQNGAWSMNGNGFSASVHDLPSTRNASRLRRSEIYNQLRSKQQSHGQQQLHPLPQLSATMCYGSHNINSSGNCYDSVNVASDSYHHHHHQQHLIPSTSMMCSNLGVTNGTIAPSSQPTLSQALDISALDTDAFVSPEHSGRRDSFSMAVDLLSRLEKRSLDTSSCNSNASPAIPVASAWNNSPPPSKSAKFDPSSTAVAISSSNPGPGFYVPIAEKDLQLLTEPSMVNYVTDAATEDQLVREQYSPS